MTLKSAVFTPVLLTLFILNTVDNGVRLNQLFLRYPSNVVGLRLALAVGAQHCADSRLQAFGKPL